MGQRNLSCGNIYYGGKVLDECQECFFFFFFFFFFFLFFFSFFFSIGNH